MDKGDVICVYIHTHTHTHIYITGLSECKEKGKIKKNSKINNSREFSKIKKRYQNTITSIQET